MSNYVKLTDFASKDALPTGNPSKIVKGTEIDDEFESIETAIATKADLASPALTGTPTAPTAATATSTTQVATTAFVQAQKADIALTGNPTAPTQTTTDDSTKIATTAFVQAQKADIALTGTPTAPTAASGTDTTQIATTAFVQTEVSDATAGINDYVVGFAVIDPDGGTVLQKTSNMTISIDSASEVSVTLTGFSDNNYGVVGTAHGSDTVYNAGRWVGIYDKSSSGFTAVAMQANNSSAAATFMTLMIVDA